MAWLQDDMHIFLHATQGLHEEADDISQLLEGPEDALLICRMMAASDMADALSAAFLCGLPGFALPIASSLSLPVLFLPSCKVAHCFALLLAMTHDDTK